MITFLHIGKKLENPAFNLSHHGLGFVEDAQGFVFLSGLVLGIVYTPLLLKHGLTRVKTALFKRMRLVYAYHVAVVVLIGAIVLVGSDYLDLQTYSRLGENILRGTIMAILMLSGPSFVDILPMYVLFIAVTPLIFDQLEKGRTIAVLGTSVCLWLIAQTELLGMVFVYLNQILGLSPEAGLQLGMTFDRTAWQLVFVVGIVIGYHWIQGNITLDFFKTSQGTYLALLSFIIFLCFVVLRDHINTAYRLFPMLPGATERWNFSILRLGNFVADAYLVAWLIVAGPESSWAFIRKVSKGLHWLFNTKALCLLGRHSLQVYAYHVVLLYVALAFIDWDALSLGVKLIGSSLVMSTIFLAAWTHGLYQKRKKSA